MRKRNLFSKYKVPQFIFLFMTLLCWSVTLLQSAAKQLKTDKAVPAFQNETMSSSETISAYQTDTLSSSIDLNSSIPLSNAIPAFRTKNSQTLELFSASKQVTRETSSSYCQSLAKQIDSNTTLLSYHSDTSYSDFYFYSPALEEQFQIPPVSTTAGNNIQIVLVWNKNGSCKHIYLGIPYIEYCF